MFLRDESSPASTRIQSPWTSSRLTLSLSIPRLRSYGPVQSATGYQSVEGTDFMTEGHQDAGLWKVPFASANVGGNWLAIRSDCRILFKKVATRFSSALCC